MSHSAVSFRAAPLAPLARVWLVVLTLGLAGCGLPMGSSSDGYSSDDHGDGGGGGY